MKTKKPRLPVISRRAEPKLDSLRRSAIGMSVVNYGTRELTCKIVTMDLGDREGRPTCSHLFAASEERKARWSRLQQREDELFLRFLPLDWAQSPDSIPVPALYRCRGRVLCRDEKACSRVLTVVVCRRQPVAPARENSRVSRISTRDLAEEDSIRATMPLVMQYNKRRPSEEEISPLEELDNKLNFRGVRISPPTRSRGARVRVPAQHASLVLALERAGPERIATNGTADEKDEGAEFVISMADISQEISERRGVSGRSLPAPLPGGREKATPSLLGRGHDPRLGQCHRPHDRGNALVAIKGSLKEASLPDVLQLLSMGKKTGCLGLSFHDSFGSIYFESGRICHASIVNRPLDTENAVYSLFTWTSGTFNFEAGVEPEPGAQLVSVDPQSRLLEGARRVDEWSLIEKKIPSFDLVYSIDGRTDNEREKLTAEQEALLPLVERARDINGLIGILARRVQVGKAYMDFSTHLSCSRSDEENAPTLPRNATPSERRELARRALSRRHARRRDQRVSRADRRDSGFDRIVLHRIDRAAPGDGLRGQCFHDGGSHAPSKTALLTIFLWVRATRPARERRLVTERAWEREAASTSHSAAGGGRRVAWARLSEG